MPAADRYVLRDLLGPATGKLYGVGTAMTLQKQDFQGTNDAYIFNTATGGTRRPGGRLVQPAHRGAWSGPAVRGACPGGLAASSRGGHGRKAAPLDGGGVGRSGRERADRGSGPR